MDPRIQNHNRDPLLVLFGYELKTSRKRCEEFLDQVGKSALLIALDTGFAFWISRTKNEKEHPLFLNATSKEHSVYETLALFFALLVDSVSKIDLGNPRLWDLIYDPTHKG